MLLKETAQGFGAQTEHQPLALTSLPGKIWQGRHSWPSSPWIRAQFEQFWTSAGFGRVAASTALDVRLLSAGQQRRAALVRTLISAAPLWIMDEPLANLDAAGRDLVLKAVDRHLEDGGIALMAENPRGSALVAALRANASAECSSAW